MRWGEWLRWMELRLTVVISLYSISQGGSQRSHSGNIHISVEDGNQSQDLLGSTCTAVYVLMGLQKTIQYQLQSICPLHTNSGCGKERRRCDLPRQHSFGSTLRFTGLVPPGSRQ